MLFCVFFVLVFVGVVGRLCFVVCFLLVEFFLAPFFLCPFFFLGGGLVSARTVPLLQAVAGEN